MADVDTAITDGRVPDGITAEYLKESRDKASIGGLIFVAVLTFLVVTARLFARGVLARRFGLDDGLAFVSLVRTPIGLPHCLSSV